MTVAEAFYGRFQELSRTNPPDLTKHLGDAERTAVRKDCLEDTQGTLHTPAKRIYEFSFHDGSRLRIVMVRRNRDILPLDRCANSQLNRRAATLDMGGRIFNFLESAPIKAWQSNATSLQC